MGEKNMQFDGKFDQIKGRVKESWGVLTDDDFDRASGKVDRLVGIIKEKTGESADSIRDKIQTLLRKGAA
jgi:uncharacterized protein YjbJ (UPF0337 family)